VLPMPWKFLALALCLQINGQFWATIRHTTALVPPWTRQDLTMDRGMDTAHFAYGHSALAHSRGGFTGGTVALPVFFDLLG
jgi:hypothetical protein